MQTPRDIRSAGSQINAARVAPEEKQVTPRKHMPQAAAVRQSPYYNLQDPPSPSGRLGDRIQRLRERCREALGREAFERAYLYLKLREVLRNTITFYFIIIVGMYSPKFFFV